MSARFVNIDRETPMLLPPDLREWVRGDDLAHFILEAVEGLDTGMAAINERGSGSEQFPPAMMMGLLLYCYAQGIFSSRRIEAATHWHISVRYLAGNTHPDHDTIATFRRVNKELVRGSFVRVLELARELGLLRVGTVAVDGTKLWANASKEATLTQSQLQEQIGLIEREVDELLQKAEAADGQEGDDGSALPRELADRAERRARLEAARLALQQKAEQRAQAAAQERARAQREGCERPRPMPARVRPNDTVNTTDMQSALQPRAREGFIQGYNAQAAVCVDSGLMLAAHVVTDTGDRRQLAPTVAAIPAGLGSPEAIIADTGYDNAAHILEIERTTGASVYCALQPPNRPLGRMGAWRKSQRRSAPQRLRQRMAARLQTEEAQRLYALRKTSIEPVFGMIKSVLGFRRFGLRGLEKVNIEWNLLAAAFNCRRLAARRSLRR
jgi:transposase